MRYLALFLALALLTGCCGGSAVPETTAPSLTFPTIPAAPTAPPEPLPKDPIQVLLEGMSIEERVGQLFLIRCNDETALEDIARYHPAGLILFSQDFQDRTPDTVRETFLSYQTASKTPLILATDEEGGTVTRVSRFPAFRSRPFPSVRESCAAGGLQEVLMVEEEKALLLRSLGINVNLGPVCDVSTDPEAFMYPRSLGLDANTTGTIVASVVQVMRENRMGCVLKHFPGYGNNADTHTGIARDSRSLSELEGRDLIPFASGMDAGCGAIMVSHTIVEAMDPEFPASLSPSVHRYLRENMGFDGVILTDDLVMEAITDSYGAGEAAVLAVLAGNDLLISTDYETQYTAVLEAAYEGRISFDLLNEAVRRVLRWKMDLGLL